jgi:hypothetical protein
MLNDASYPLPRVRITSSIHPRHLQRKRANFQELAAEGLMTKVELRSKLDTLALARKAAEPELRLASEPSERDHRPSNVTTPNTSS